MLYEAFASLQTPVWVYDIERFAMVWANPSALAVWRAESLEELQNRGFADVSETMRTRLKQYQSCFGNGKTVRETWTFYPKQESVIHMECFCSGATLEDGRNALLVEGHLIQEQQIKSYTLRAVEIIRQTSCLLSLFDLQGNVLFQNPAAIAVYGPIATFTDRFQNPEVARSALQAIQHHTTWQEECEMRTQEGRRWHRLEMRKTCDSLTGKTAFLLNETDITERLLLEAERQRIALKFKESAQAHDTLLQALAEGVVMQGADGQVIACNDKAQAILGLELEQLMGRSSVDPNWRVIREDGSPFPVEEHPATVSLRTGEPQRQVVMGVAKPDGSLVWLSVNSQPIWQPGDTTPRAVVASFADITALKAAAIALRESEARWQYALEGNGDGLWDWNIQTDRVYFSPRWKAMLGYAEHEIGDTLDEWQARLHPDDKARCAEDLQRHFRGEVADYCNEYRLRCKDGTYKWILDRGKVVEWSDTGEPLRVIGTHTEVTARHEMEDTLRQQAEMLYAIVSHIPIMLAFFDHQGKMQFVNQALEAVLGWSFREWQAVNRMPDCYPDLANLQRVIEHMQAANGQWQDFKTQTASGQVIDTSWVNIRLSDGRCIGIGQDISHRKEAEEAQRLQVLRDRVMLEISQRISQSLNLTEVLETAVTEMRQLLEAHRLLVCKVSPDELSSLIIAEATAPGCSPLQRAGVCDRCPFGNGSQCCLLLSQQSFDPATYPIRNVADIYTARLADAELALLEKFQVRAFLIIPILQNERLWGILVAQHCDAPREWQTWEIHMLRQLADQLAIAVQKAELYEQLQKANHELHHMATHDKLTGLANRRYFDTYLEQEWRRLSREKAPLSIILCDIDHFKIYNDTLGHVAGDECLIQVAQAIASSIKRPADLAARYGGEEFAIILPNTNLEGAQQAAERLRQVVEQQKIPHFNSPVKPQITLSAGIACVQPSTLLNIEEFVSMADWALYRAKTTGRDRFCVAMNSSAS